MARLNFNQFFNMINGTPYENVPPPVDYDFQDYTQQITSSPVNNTEDSSSWKLRPLGFNDMGQAAADDVAKHFEKMKQAGHNTTRLGAPLSDDEFKKYTGQTW